ncbi:MAG TPA: hypothetical protein VGZ32_07690 [Actinocrinis sp.]|uniref:hypothetical protein n=1 Tax=Actinocrinis sp. TaxID=1920516 RepID=UPI002DDDB7FD|nr:hypothetical protein [Actinocrinis sp.]HEV3170204.1 hypothetical protein [Actinocrinis sp.]
MSLVASRSGRWSASAVAAWCAATAAAAGVAWLGVDSVLIPAAEAPPAVIAAGASPTSAPDVATPTEPPSPPTHTSLGLGGVSITSKHSASPSVSASASASGSPSASGAGTLSRYQTGGGVVVLSMTSDSAALVSATPAAGYSVQNWGAAGWLRVDFTEGSTVYSVYATWNGYSPKVQVVGPN